MDELPLPKCSPFLEMGESFILQILLDRKEVFAFILNELSRHQV